VGRVVTWGFIVVVVGVVTSLLWWSFGSGLTSWTIWALLAVVAFVLLCWWQFSDDVSKAPPATIAALMYLLITAHFRRFVAVMVTFGAAFGVSAQLVGALFQPKVLVTGNGVELHTEFGKRQYQQVIHPFGWQDTGIQLERGDRLSVLASGLATVGYLEYQWDYLSFRLSQGCLVVNGGYVQAMTTLGTTPAKAPSRLRRKQEPCVFFSRSQPKAVQWPADGEAEKWPWRPASGLETGRYGDPRYASDRPEKESDWLAIPQSARIAHGRLVGYLAETTQTLKPTVQVTGERVIDLADWKAEDAVERSGKLWVAINDSRTHLHDNLGFFVLTVTIER
jgi:hypothetical protein